MMNRLRKKIIKAKAECKAYDNIRLYSHNFGDFAFYKSMNFRSSFLKNLAAERNKELNQKQGKWQLNTIWTYFCYNTTLFCSTVRKILKN